jgi:hypothetical protein
VIRPAALDAAGRRQNAVRYQRTQDLQQEPLGHPAPLGQLAARNRTAGVGTGQLQSRLDGIRNRSREFHEECPSANPSVHGWKYTRTSDQVKRGLPCQLRGVVITRIAMWQIRHAAAETFAHGGPGAKDAMPLQASDVVSGRLQKA